MTTATPAGRGVKGSALPASFSTERAPRMAIQGTEWHRHFRLDGRGYVEHSHAIGRRTHEHLAARLGRVMLSWADEGPADRPFYENTPLLVRDEALLFTVSVMLVVLIAAAFGVGR